LRSGHRSGCWQHAPQSRDTTSTSPRIHPSHRHTPLPHPTTPTPHHPRPQDGRTIRYPDPLIKKGDTVKVDLESGKVTEFVKFEVGNTVMVTKGRNTGRVGTLVQRDAHPGSFDIVHVKDAEGATFATRIANVFVIGKGGNAKDALVSLPRGKGIKRDIFHERDSRRRAAGKA
jgi:small subunit ribosomal protein S4e